MKRILLALIGYYQRCISPYKGGACCKYIPTCSEYAKQAIVTHGAFKGAALAIWRVMRCNPFAKGGYDPVPQKKKKVGK